MNTENTELELEFSRPLPLQRIPDVGTLEQLQATPEECSALAVRMKLPTISSVTARLQIEPWKRGGIRVRGTFSADIEQICVISLDQFASTITGEIERFFERGHGGNRGKVLTLDVADEMDPDPITGDSIDLGEIVAEILALSLEAHPKKPGVSFEQSDFGTDDNGENAADEIAADHPFASLKKLK